LDSAKESLPSVIAEIMAAESTSSWLHSAMPLDQDETLGNSQIKKGGTSRLRLGAFQVFST
jgi:hypothetical protein